MPMVTDSSGARIFLPANMTDEVIKPSRAPIRPSRAAAVACKADIVADAPWQATIRPSRRVVTPSPTRSMKSTKLKSVRPQEKPAQPMLPVPKSRAVRLLKEGHYAEQQKVQERQDQSVKQKHQEQQQGKTQSNEGPGWMFKKTKLNKQQRKALREYKLTNPRLVCKIPLVKGANCGFILGTGGRNVQPIKDETGAVIRICGRGSWVQSGTDMDEPLHMRIECWDQDALDTAVAMAKDLMSRVLNYSPYDESPPEGHVFAHSHKLFLNDIVDSETAGHTGANAHILGKGARNFKQIRDDTGAWLWLRGRGAGGVFEEGGADAEPLHILLEHDDWHYLEQAIALTRELLDSVSEHVSCTICSICGGQHFSYRCPFESRGAGRPGKVRRTLYEETVKQDD